MVDLKVSGGNLVSLSLVTVLACFVARACVGFNWSFMVWHIYTGRLQLAAAGPSTALVAKASFCEVASQIPLYLSP